MSSGIPASSLGGSAIRNPSQTLPAPARIAARPARMSAPPIPSVPPRIPSVPKVPLLTLRVRRASTRGNAAASAGQSRQCPRASPSGAIRQRVHRYLAALVRAIQREQAGLEGDERCRREGADGWRVRVSRCTVDAGWNVEREDGRAAVVRPLDQLGNPAFRRPREADPEQAIDRRVLAGAMAVLRVVPPPVGERLVGRRGILRQSPLVASKDDVHVVIAAAQQTGNDECVAAVVAGTGKDDDGAPPIAAEAQGDVRRRSACALHETVRRMPGLDGAQLVEVEDGLQCRCHCPIIGRRVLR